MEYKYLGDKHTDPEMKNIVCTAIRRKDGKCVRGKNGSMLVQSSNGKNSLWLDGY
jgi:hypothetical protein